MKFGSVCSGIEAASVAFGPLGWKAAWFSEIEPFPCAVLAHHYPEVPNLGDMTTLVRRILQGDVAAPDLLCGGTPCQAFSVAGKRQSLDDARGNLTLTFCEIADAIDHVRAARGEQPAVILWENVPGVLSTRDNAFGCFLGEISGSGSELQPPGGRWTDAGCVYGPTRAVAWRVLDAQFFQLAQRRRRVFVVASARNGFDPGAVLFESDGVRRDSPPSREAWKDTAGSIGASPASGGLNWPADVACTLNASFGDKQGLEDQHVNGGGRYSSLPESAACLTTGTGQRYDAETETLIPTFGGGFDVAHTLRAEGFDASEDGTGRGTPLVPVSVALRGRDGGATAEMGDEVAFGLRASGGGGDKPHVLAPVATFAIQAGALRTNPASGHDGVGVQADHAYTLEARAEVQAVAHAIRTAQTGSNGWGVNTDGTAYMLDSAQQAVAVPNYFTCDECGEENAATWWPTCEWCDHDHETFPNGAASLTCSQQEAAKPIAFHHNAQACQLPGPNTDTDTSASLTCSQQAAVAFAQNQRDEVRVMEVAGALAAEPGAKQQTYLQQGMAVRRLTPVECERLMGFPDSYTSIPWRKKPAEDCPDGPRYRALGNSWAIPVVRWIGQRIDSVLSRGQTRPSHVEAAQKRSTPESGEQRRDRTGS